MKESERKKRPFDRREFVTAAGGAVALTSLLAAGTASAKPKHGKGETKHLIKTVTKARLFDLSFIWDEDSPIAGVNPPYASSLNATHEDTRGTFGDGGQLSFASEIQQWSGQHGAPSIDAIGHIGHNGLLYGGVDAAAATSDPRGIGYSGVGEELGIDSYPADKLVNRAVLLDVARLINGNMDPLPANFEITANHLEDAAAAAKVSIDCGDTVLIRTGWGQFFEGDPNLYVGDESPGPSVDAASWVVSQGAFATGNDTLTYERRPPLVFEPQFQVFPVHMLLIADNGIHIIENFFLEELAAEEVYEFLLVVPPLKIRGGTGSGLRAFALA
jgi:kynurenine formamidase